MKKALSRDVTIMIEQYMMMWSGSDDPTCNIRLLATLKPSILPGWDRTTDLNLHAT